MLAALVANGALRGIPPPAGGWALSSTWAEQRRYVVRTSKTERSEGSIHYSVYSTQQAVLSKSFPVRGIQCPVHRSHKPVGRARIYRAVRPSSRLRTRYGVLYTVGRAAVRPCPPAAAGPSTART